MFVARVVGCGDHPALRRSHGRSYLRRHAASRCVLQICFLGHAHREFPDCETKLGSWHVGVHTCWGQSFVTLGSTRVDPQSPPDRVVLGVYTCGGQSYVTLGSTRVDPKVPPKSVGVNTCSPQSYVTLPPARYGGNKWVRSRGLPVAIAGVVGLFLFCGQPYLEPGACPARGI